MTVLRLLTSSDCHLCEHGKRVLDDIGVTWREVKAESEEGRGLAAVGAHVAVGRCQQHELGHAVNSARMSRSSWAGLTYISW